jgi:hypothetical protein
MMNATRNLTSGQTRYRRRGSGIADLLESQKRMLNVQC